MRGTLLGALSGVLRAIFTYGAEMSRLELLVGRAFMGLFALLFGNAYIVGLNQIYDVKIDKINKPFLPIASGELRPKLAWIIVVVSGILGLLLVKTFFSPLIFGLYLFGMTIASLYSIPPFRLKRFPIIAALTISCVRGFLMNFGVYHATIDALGIPFAWNPPIVFLAAFMSVFACIIAISKDLPDISGDVAAGIPTFASRKGTKFIVKLVAVLLAANYASAIAVAIFSLVTGAQLFNAWVMIVGHAILAMTLGHHMKFKVDTEDKMSIKKFYAFIWQLFYAEYVLFPFI